MDALDKILLAAGQRRAMASLDEDPAADLVAAASALLDELVIELSKKDPDGDGDDDSSAKGDTDHDFWTKKGKKKKPKGKGKSSGSDDDEDDDDEDEDKAEVKKKVKASVLAAAARVALAGLDSRPAGYDWVEATSAPLSAAETLHLAAGDDSAPGYADPGYQGKKRYPLGTQHIHATVANFARGQAGYTPDQVKAIWARIKTAASASAVPDVLVALAGQAVDGGVPMHHPPFQGSHNHPHSVMNVHSHAHNHNNDSHHACGNGGSMY